jgi:PAS domain-containing protein
MAGPDSLLLSGRLVEDPSLEEDGPGPWLKGMTKQEYGVELIDYFENAPIALHWLGCDGNIIWANKRELEMLGYTAEEYIGHPLVEFCPDEVGV